jgi:hypothetical protein
MFRAKSFKDLMDVSKDNGGDYYINLSRDGAEKLKNPIGNYIPPLKYNWLESKVSSENEKVDEYLFLTCSNDSSVAFCPGQVTLKKEGLENPYDSTVRIFPLALDKLSNGEEEFLMTRYDGKNKIWIFLK